MEKIKHRFVILLLLTGFTGCASLQQQAAEQRVGSKTDVMLMEINQRVHLSEDQRTSIRLVILSGLMDIEMIEIELADSPFLGGKIGDTYSTLDQNIRALLTVEQSSQYDRYCRYRDDRLRKEMQESIRMERENQYRQ